MQFPEIINETITEFFLLSKNHWIDRPNDLIQTGLQLPTVFNHGNLKDRELFFTRKSLKHICEKNKIEFIINNMYDVLLKPDEILKGEGSRVLFSKTLHYDDNPLPFVVVLDISQRNIIITAFSAKTKYLKNFEILWRTETLTNCPSIST